jgi:hypothetical protein
MFSQQPPKLSDSQMEEFLSNARVQRCRTLSVGITGSQRCTLTDGRLTHEADVQTIDEFNFIFNL